MSRYVIPLQVEDKEFEIVVGFDYQTRNIFWSATATEPEFALLGNSTDGSSLENCMREEMGVDLSQFMSATSISLDDLLDEDSTFCDLRREMSNEEITNLGLKVVDPNRVISFPKVLLPPAQSPSI